MISNHPLKSDEIAALKTIRKHYKDHDSYYVFVNKCGQMLTVAAIQKIISRAADAAQLQLFFG